MASSSGSLIATEATEGGDEFYLASGCCLNANLIDVLQQNFPSRSRLDLVIEDIVSDNGGEGPEKDQTDELIRKRLGEMYDQPKVSQLEVVLHKRITKEEARHILFFPDEDQAGYYRVLIANAPKGAPLEHPQRTLQIPHLSMLYLQHWKRWDFVSAFVLAGGLHALSSLFTHENFVIRANAINTFVNITAHRDFDWFARPARCGDGSTTEARLHRAMLRLRSDPAFIPGLIANSWGTPEGAHDRPAVSKKGGTFPGGCLICLEVLAMWLSWVRALHTVDRRLRLSRSLLRAIENWGGDEAPLAGDLVKRLRMSPTSSPTLSPPVQPGGEHADKNANDRSQKDCQHRGHLLPGDKTTLAKDTNGSPYEVGMVAGEEGAKDPRRNAIATISQPTGVKTSERTVIPRPGEETTFEVQREERTMVLKLAKTLVDDFGRLSPAEEEWEDLREYGDSEGGANGNHVEEHCSTVSASASAASLPPETSSNETANSTVGELDSETGRNDPCIEERSEIVTNSAQEKQTLSSNGCPAEEKKAGSDTNVDVDAALLPDPIRQAEALKAEGNEAFGRGNLEEAQRAYSNALSALDAAGFPVPPLPSLSSTSSRIERSSPSEANTLRGVLHRNRAAVSLRFFDRAMVSSPAASNKTTMTTNPNVGASETCSVGEGPAANVDGCSSPQLRPSLSAEREASGGVPGQTDSSSLKNADNCGEQRAIALLEQCEEDCLRAIEVNATDKKALFRLARCREVRRRYRRGAAAASAGSDIEQERRRQEKKAALVAKILAREKDADSQEDVLGGARGAGTTPSTVLSTIKCDIKTAARQEHVKTSSRCSISLPSQTSESRTSDRRGMLGVADSDGSGKKVKEETVVSASVRGEQTMIHATPAPIEDGQVTGEIGRDVSVVSSIVIGEGEHISPHPAVDNNGMTEGDVTGGRKSPQKDTKKKRRNKRHGTTRGTVAVESPGLVVRGAGSVPRFPTSRERSLLRRLRAFVGRVAARSRQKQAVVQLETHMRETEVKELWEFLVSLPAECGGLEALLGDGITAESLGCIVRSLSYACDVEAGVSTDGLKGGTGAARTTGRVYKLFLELSRVKRVGLASAMCSTADKQALQRISDYVRRCNLQSSQTHIEDMRAEIDTAVQELGV